MGSTGKSCRCSPLCDALGMKLEMIADDMDPPPRRQKKHIAASAAAEETPQHFSQVRKKYLPVPEQKSLSTRRRAISADSSRNSSMAEPPKAAALVAPVQENTARRVFPSEDVDSTRPQSGKRTYVWANGSSSESGESIRQGRSLRKMVRAPRSTEFGLKDMVQAKRHVPTPGGGDTFSNVVPESSSPLSVVRPHLRTKMEQHSPDVATPPQRHRPLRARIGGFSNTHEHIFGAAAVDANLPVRFCRSASTGPRNTSPWSLDG